MLNEISSFPTSLFLNEKGEIVFIHTGFNGPGTGDVFKNYKKEIEKRKQNGPIMLQQEGQPPRPLTSEEVVKLMHQQHTHHYEE